MAVAGMIAGMTVWRIWWGFRLELAGAYIQLALYLFLIALFDALVILSVLVWVPNLHDASEIKLTEQFHFLKNRNRG